MNKFLPLTGGHDFRLDDLKLMQDSYLEAFKALTRVLSPTGNCILDGVFVSITVSSIIYTDGYISIAGEIYKVDTATFAKSGNPADVLYFKPQETIIPPSPVTYEDTGAKNVHFERKAILKYKAVGDTDGIEYAKCLRAFAGQLMDWIPPAGTVVSDFFDTTGMGIDTKIGWAICNGLNGTPDLRGFFTAQATNVPSSGAGSLSGSLSGVTTNVGDAQGLNKVQLVVAELPQHRFELRKQVNDTQGGSQQNTMYDGTDQGGTNRSFFTEYLGNDQPHENRPPTFYCYKIMRLN